MNVLPQVTERTTIDTASQDQPLAKREELLLARNPDWKLGETQNPLTGYAGLTVLILCAVSLAWAGEHTVITSSPLWAMRYLLVVTLIFASMAMMEIMVFKVHRRNFDFSAAKQTSPESAKALGHTLLGFYTCLVMVGALFAITNIWFPGFFIFYIVFGLALGLAAPVYFINAQKYVREDAPIDELQLLGEWLTSILCRSSSKSKPGRHSEVSSGSNSEARSGNGSDAGSESNSESSMEGETEGRSKGGSKGNWEGTMSSAERSEHLANLLRGLVIKAFFIPFMTISCITLWNKYTISIHQTLHSDIFAPLGTIESARGLHTLFLTLINLIVVVDVTIALLGYLTSSRFLDTQFTTAEPTPLGWFSAMVCYPPFNYFFETSAMLLTYQLCWPIPMFQEQPLLAICASATIVIFKSIYSWATVVFGLRFSNLTNRGIICSGPYRVVRHPAYAAKNTAWWIAFVPAIMMLGSAALIPAVILLVLNSTYVLRALTEERHLMREDHYAQYCRRVKWKFIPGVW